MAAVHPMQQTTFYVNEYAYETVEFTPKRPMQRKIVIRKDGNKKCLVVMCFILLFTLVLSISVGLIAFPLEIIKLTVEIDLEAMLTEDVLVPFPPPPATPPRPKRCEDGPARVIHTVKHEFHWPPIYRGSCSKLFCKDPPCLVRKKVWRKRCVLVYRLVHGYWKRIGFRTRRYEDHLACGCKECGDIISRSTCIRTKPCPNSANPKSFCFYKPGKCACCVPYPCPRGQIFDRDTCSCVCPKGSRKVGNKCIGDCSDISLGYCKFVNCIFNPQFNCFIKNHKCQCKSCDAQTSAFKCPSTRCIEQRNNPYCVYDTYTNKCRCPKCSDRQTKSQCVNSYHCGGSVCRYNGYTNKCFCPH